MLDIGWGELLVIGVVALIVVGPKDLPGLFRTVGQFMGRARGMAREFQRSMEAAADESGLNEVSRNLKIGDRLNLNSATSSARKYAQGLVKEVDAAASGAAPAGAPKKAKAKAKAAPAEAPAAAAPPADDAAPAGDAPAVSDAAAR